MQWVIHVSLKTTTCLPFSLMWPSSKLTFYNVYKFVLSVFFLLYWKFHLQRASPTRRWSISLPIVFFFFFALQFPVTWPIEPIYGRAPRKMTQHLTHPASSEQLCLLSHFIESVFFINIKSPIFSHILLFKCPYKTQSLII